MNKPILYIIVPCYNESRVLPYTAPSLYDELLKMIESEKINEESKLLFIDDGSKDASWRIIREFAGRQSRISGIRLEQNYGHQMAIYAGMKEAKESCDIAISIDADGQQDPGVMGDMIDAYMRGSEIVCAVRAGNRSPGLIKRLTADAYYIFMKGRGVSLIKGHSDYRLVSKDAIIELEKLPKKTLFLRGDFLKLSKDYTCVKYSLKKRAAGRSKYTAAKMIELAVSGLVSNGICQLPYKQSTDYVIAERI